MNTCETCKWWDSSFINHRDCGICRRHGSSGGYPDCPDTLAYASDSESYGASFKTSPLFACNEWVSRIEWKDK